MRPSKATISSTFSYHLFSATSAFCLSPALVALTSYAANEGYIAKEHNSEKKLLQKYLLI